MKYIDAEKLKAKIKHLKLDVYDEAHQFDLGARSALSYIEQFIDSLQQEQPGKGLDVTEFCKPIDPGIAQCVADHWWEMLDGKEPSESLEEAAEKAYPSTTWKEGKVAKHITNLHCQKAFKAGAEWMADHFEKKRLRDCDELTPEDAQLEDAFVESHFKKNQRTPTFIDAINYGMGRQKEQMLKDAVECVVCAGMEGNKWIMSYIGNYESMIKTCKAGDKVKIIIIKEKEK